MREVGVDKDGWMEERDDGERRRQAGWIGEWSEGERKRQSCMNGGVG